MVDVPRRHGVGRTFFVAWLRWHGAGDVKVIVGICLYLGVMNTLIAFALMVPALIGLMVRAWIKTKTLKSAIPSRQFCLWRAALWRSAIYTPYFKYKGGKAT